MSNNLDVDIVIVGVNLIAVSVAVSPFDLFLLTWLHADECLLKLLWSLGAIKGKNAVLALHVSSTLNVLDVYTNGVALFDSALLLGVLKFSLVRQKLLDLVINLSLSCLIWWHVDCRSIVRIKLSLRTNVEDYLVGVILALNRKVCILVVITTANRNKVKLLKKLWLCCAEKIVGCLSKDCLAANNAVNDRTRCAALAETLEGILVCNVLVSLLNGSVYLCSRNCNLDGEFLVNWLICGNGDVQRSSSVS